MSESAMNVVAQYSLATNPKVAQSSPKLGCASILR